MIKINMPLGFGQGFMQGAQLGASITPTPQDLQRAQFQNQLMQSQLAQLPQQQQMNAMKLALLKQQVQNAQTPETIRVLQALAGGAANAQAPASIPMNMPTSGAPSSPDISSLIPSLQTGSPVSAQSLFGQTPINGAQSPIAQDQIPASMPQTIPQAQALNSLFSQSQQAPQTSLPEVGQPSSTIAPTSPATSASNLNNVWNNLNPLQKSYLSKITGYDPEKQQYYSERGQQALASQRGQIGQAIHVANASDDELKRMGLPVNEQTRSSYAASIIKQLPSRQQNQMISSPDFIEHFNQLLKPMTEKFVQDLKTSGIKGWGKLSGSRLMTLIGNNKTLYDEYKNLMTAWSAAVSDYRSGLGDNATNYQTKYIQSILDPDFTNRSIGGQLENFNNLLKYSDIAINDTIKNSPLQSVKEHLHYSSPDYFDVDRLTAKNNIRMKAPDGAIYHIPLNKKKEAIASGFIEE